MDRNRRLIDLSLQIRDGMRVHEHVPHPVVTVLRDRRESDEWEQGAARLDRFRFIGCTGTYLMAPYQFDVAAPDIAGLDVARLFEMPVTVVAAEDLERIGPDVFEGCEGSLEGHAVLIRTGHSDHWGEPAYYEEPPALTADAVDVLIAARPLLVGSDSQNFDSSEGEAGTARHVFRDLLAAGIPLIQSLASLAGLPPRGALLTAVCAPITRTGAFPVRAVATVQETA